jgi:ribosomal protein L40E
MQTICAHCGTENTTEATICTQCRGALRSTASARPTNTDMAPRIVLAILGMLFAPFLLQGIEILVFQVFNLRLSPVGDTVLLYSPILVGLIFALTIPTRWSVRVIIAVFYAPSFT